MATVTETLDLPAGGTPEVTVTIELVGTGGHPVRGFVTGTSTIVGKLTPTLTAGGYSAVLVANDSITPANTVYKRSVNGRGYSAVDYFEVPTGSSSHTLFSLLTDPPGALTPSGLAAHIADEGMGGHLPLGGTEDQVPVVQADGSVAWEDPAAGGVESVDGATGAVVLTGTYSQLDGDGDLAIGGTKLTEAAFPATLDRVADRQSAITALINGAPASGDTLGELHARLAVVEALGSLATDAELIAAVAALIGSADTAGDTLGELQALIGLRMLKSANLSDLANVSTALTNLGFSAFVKTLIDDADASTFLGTLGVSTFIKTLLDDADAATARATLGASTGLASPTIFALTNPSATSSGGYGRVDIGGTFPFAQQRYSLAPATNDWIEWQIWLGAGTYTLNFHTQLATANGKYQFSLDGSNIGALMDNYANPGGQVTSDQTGIVVPTTGVHTLRLSTNGKNGSASSYYIVINAISFTRTA